MAVPITYRPLREKTSVMRSKYLFEIYMREGDQLMRDGQYRKAVQSYDAALQMSPNSLAGHVGKSKCHHRLGYVKQALADVELALAVDNIYTPAVLQKADIFYSLKNYEMALLFYHRGHKVTPKDTFFRDGIANCQRHISDIAKRKTMKLTAAGDLTIYVHKKMTKMGRGRRHLTPPPSISSRMSSSAGKMKRKQFVNPIVRLGRKQPIKLSITTKKANQKQHNKRSCASRASGGTVFSEPDEKNLKEILGEMYDDRLYLKDVFRETECVESRLGVEVNCLAESGLQFLFDRVTYWNYRRLQPDPTPSPPLSQKRSRQNSSTLMKSAESPLPRQKSSLWEREVSDLLRMLCNGQSKEHSVIEDDVIPGYRPYKKEKKKVKMLYFEFATYRPGSDIERGTGGIITEQQNEGTEVSGEDQDEYKDEEDYIMNYLLKELTDLDHAFEQEDFDQCRRSALSCLQSVYSYSEEEIADKLDLIAKVHSILGNSLIELGDFEAAQEHHEKDLEIGEKCNLDEAMSRSLGNLGRVFIYRKQYHKALGAFARKTKLVDRAVEKAWLFHEIGDCFLSLHQYGYARDAGRKSLQAAEEDEHRMYQLQACVLIGVAQVKLFDYDAAYQEFERALDIAKTEGDKDSEQMITRALKEVNTLITERTRRSIEHTKETKQSDIQQQQLQKLTPVKEQADGDMRERSHGYEDTTLETQTQPLYPLEGRSAVGQSSSPDKSQSEDKENLNSVSKEGVLEQSDGTLYVNDDSPLIHSDNTGNLSSEETGTGKGLDKGKSKGSTRSISSYEEDKSASSTENNTSHSKPSTTDEKHDSRSQGDTKHLLNSRLESRKDQVKTTFESGEVSGQSQEKMEHVSEDHSTAPHLLLNKSVKENVQNKGDNATILAVTRSNKNEETQEGNVTEEVLTPSVSDDEESSTVADESEDESEEDSEEDSEGESVDEQGELTMKEADNLSRKNGERE